MTQKCYYIKNKIKKALNISIFFQFKTQKKKANEG